MRKPFSTPQPLIFHTVPTLRLPLPCANRAVDGSRPASAGRPASKVDIKESRKELLTIELENDKQNATAVGEAEGLRRASSVGQFLATLQPDLPESKERLAACRFLAGQEGSTAQLATTSKNLCSGSARLFVTPNDLNLRMQAAVGDSGGSGMIRLTWTEPETLGCVSHE